MAVTSLQTGRAESRATPGGILYLSYEGMLEPLGQSQVISYLERLSTEVPIHVISFEKPADWTDCDLRQSVTERLASAGIHWHPLRYHKRPTVPATAFDIAQGVSLGLWLLLRHRLSVIHARAYVPALMALAIKKMSGLPFIFDARGFWPDERVDGGIWTRGSVVYRAAKAFERRFFRAADRVVVLTKAAAEEVRRFPYLSGKVPPIAVIPTCADLDRFAPANRKPPGFVLGYVGAVGNWYDFAATAKVFARLKTHRPDARMLVVNRGEHELVHSAMAAEGLAKADYEIVAARHADVPELVRRMSAAILIARPAYSHLGRSPTKLAEFLGCGLPCLINPGVGDTEATIEDNRVGIIIRNLDDESIDLAINELLAMVNEPDVRERCRATAVKVYSLDGGVRAYREIYRSLGLHMAAG